MKAKRDIKISTFNTHTLKKIIKTPELITSAETIGQDIIYVFKNIEPYMMTSS